MNDHGIPILDLEVVEFMAKTIRHISVDAHETVEIEFVERNAAGQVLDRYTTRVDYPPLAVRMARADATRVDVAAPDPVDAPV